MTKSSLLSLIAAVCLFSVLAPDSHAQGAADKKLVLQKAHEAYCNLRSQGLLEYQAGIKPNWEVVLGDPAKSDPKSREAGLKLLNGLHFSMKLNPADKVTVDHSSDAPPPNEKVAAAFQQIYSGMDQALDGFFATWSLFMLNSPFPGVKDEYQLEESGSEYRLAWKEKNDEVVANLNKSLVMTRIKITSKAYNSTINPQFTKTPVGLVLSGYEADYIPASGPGVVHLKIKISYQEVGGLQLPQILSMDSVYDGVPNQMELRFLDYQVKKK